MKIRKKLRDMGPSDWETISREMEDRKKKRQQAIAAQAQATSKGKTGR